jgi:ATP-dependent Lon protease
MKIKELFLKPVDRPIEGVIKADDDRNLQTELEEYVVTRDVATRVEFRWSLDHSPNFHARSITTDTGWKITIDRGLDIFQRFESGPFSVEQAIQEARLTRGAEVSYVML